jgi:hypothetical protein
VVRFTRFALPGLLAGLAALPAAAQNATQPATPFASVRGFAFDSIRRVPMSHAIVGVEGTNRIGIADASGNFTIDSIPIGSHRLVIEHPVLDTLGITVVTGTLVMRPGETVTVEMGTPSPERMVAMRCNAAQMARFGGTAALMGRVIDPDSLKPATGARVQLVYEETVLGYKGKPIVRESLVDSLGGYRICGLPDKVTGKLQVFRNGVSTGQVDVDYAGTLGLRSLSISHVATTVQDSLGRARQVAVGNSRLTGKVSNKAGRPIEGARISIEGSSRVVLTNARGEFRMDSLPSGTQALEVKKLGYASTGQPIELSSRSPASANVIMDVVELAPVEVISSVKRAFDDNGYNERKRQGLGHFIDGAEMEKSIRFSDALRMVPNLKVVPAGNNRSVIRDARTGGNGCVNIYVDGNRWTEMDPGDLDDFVNPSEVRGVETYTANYTPARYITPGMSSCATVLVWTNRYIDRFIKKK